MSEVTIFRQGNTGVVGKREPTELGKTLAASGLTYRRIQTNVNGTFKKLVNGDQIGNAVRGDLDVIIVGALPQVSRIYYREKYDPNKDPTLPNCWSNLGEVPEAEATQPQAKTCMACPQNIKGSGDNGGRACRYQRRISVLVAGDTSGDVYQFNIPAKSLFGKGVGNVHPFESYVKFLLANNESPDTVITNISYDPDAESMELRFSPQRVLTDDEYQLVLAAQQNPDTNRYTQLTVAAVDRAKPPAGSSTQAEAAAAAPKPKREKVKSSAEPDEDEGGAAPEASAPEPELRQPVDTTTDEGKASLAEAIKDWTE